MEAEIDQRRGGQAGGVPGRALHDHGLVVVAHLRDPVRTPGGEPPLEYVPLDHDRTGQLAFRTTLGLRSDVDHQTAHRHHGRQLLRCHPPDPAAGIGQQLVGGPRHRAVLVG